MVRSSLHSSLQGKLAIDRPLLFTAILGLVFTLGIVLRLYDLGAESYWLDEVTMVRLTAGPIDTVIEHTQLGRPPVFVFLAYAWVQLFGTSELATRMLTALASIAALFVFYRLARMLFDQHVALLALMLMSISEFQIYHAQNFRYYSLFELITLLSFLCFILFTRSAVDAHKRSHTLIYAALYVLTTVLMFYTHSFGVFVIMAQGLYALTQWRRLKALWLPWFITQCVIAIMIAPGFLIAFLRSSGGDKALTSWIPASPFRQFALSLLKFVFPARNYPGPLTLGAGVLVFLAITGVFMLYRKRQWFNALASFGANIGAAWREWPLLTLLGLWLLCPTLVPTLMSFFVGSQYVDRFGICAAPALYLLIAWVLVALRQVVPPLAVVALLAVWIAPGLRDYYVLSTNEQWREVAAYVEQHSQPHDLIVFAPAELGITSETLGPGLHRAFSWYYQGDLPHCNLSEQLTEQAAIATAVEQCVPTSARIWLILRGSPERIKPFTTFFLDSKRAELRRTDERQFTDISLYQFTRASR